MYGGNKAQHPSLDIEAKHLYLKYDSIFFKKKYIGLKSKLIGGDIIHGEAQFPIETISDLRIEDLMLLKKYLTIDQFLELDKISDKEIVLAAVTNRGATLEFACKELQNDKEIVLASISNDGHALEYAGYQFRIDREFVLKAVRKNGTSIDFALCQLDIEIIEEALKNNGRALKYIPLEYRSNEKIVMVAVANCRYSLEYASDDLKNGGFHTYLVRKLTQYKVSQRSKMTFMIASKPLETNKCVLSMLSGHGYHFASIFKKTIVSFIDDPYDKYVVAASKNLF
jgi:hypothetical protein